MAFPAGLTDRSDEMRFRNAQQSPRDEHPTFPSLASPLRGIGSQMQQAHTPTASDARGSLHRRFTTNTVPTLPTLSPLSPIGQQRRQAAENSDYSTATYHKVQLLEKKKLEYEYLREQRRRFEAEMELLDLQAKNQEDEMVRLASDLNRYNLSGRQSEPTTPPEYGENGFTSIFPRQNRFSSASLTSPPGLNANRASRSGSQITSPPHHMTSQSISHIPSKSMPGSRRNSDEEEDTYDFDDLKTTDHRSAAALNRNSMPVTGYDLSGRSDLPDFSAVLGHIDTAGFLFDDEHDNKAPKLPKPNKPMDSKTFLHMNTTDDGDKFPVLIRRDGEGGMRYSTSSAALDLATTQPTASDQSSGWPSFARHRQAQHSLPQNTMRQAEEAEQPQHEDNIFETPKKNMMNNRRSVEVKFSPFGESKRPSLITSPTGAGSNGMPKLQSSFSTNDIPTMKGLNGNSNSVNSHAEHHLHKHNQSLGRIPPGALNNGQPNEAKPSFQPMQSALHASAAPFGPNLTSAATTSSTAAPTAAPSNGVPQYNNGAPFYGGYGVPMNNPPMAMPQQAGWSGTVQGAFGNPYNNYGGQVYQNFTAPAGTARYTDSQSRVIQQRRQASSHEAHTRFQNFDLVTMRSEILGLCKDQYGCRFLQKKIEERDAQHIQIIFEETKDAVVDLMTDPFGNYLCQKLLEFSNDDQRTALIRNAAPQMVTIALNQHGTRALQKMIEFIHTPEQISTIISALSFQVVPLIQDLNGNHVIQKCLNHLQPQDAQFIFTAVGNNCMAVGTHRHGCCVLQRCIDHASGDQKSELIRQITENSIDLVQDPFGNYVVQYILDLHQPSFTQPLCLKFVGKIVPLSKQKFSSNVIEKCIRVADADSKRLLIQELLVPGELEKVLRDSFANYVIQTALDYADDDICTMLIDSIRPVLPSIRQTPYGRRIQSKLQERADRLGLSIGGSISGSGGATPRESNGIVNSPVTSPMRNQGLPMASNVTSPGSTYSNGYSSNIASPQPHRLSNAQLPAHLQNTVQQQFPNYGRNVHQQDGSNGFNNFF